MADPMVGSRFISVIETPREELFTIAPRPWASEAGGRIYDKAGGPVAEVYPEGRFQTDDAEALAELIVDLVNGGRGMAAPPSDIEAAERPSTPPRRRYVVTIEIGADTWEDAAAAIRFAACHVVEHGPECKSVMGGPSSGHTITVEHRPEMTHDAYFAAVDRYLAERRCTSIAAEEMGATDG